MKWCVEQPAQALTVWENKSQTGRAVSPFLALQGLGKAAAMWKSREKLEVEVFLLQNPKTETVLRPGWSTAQ